VHAKSTGELISFEFSDRSVRSLVSLNRWVQSENDFLADRGISPNLGSAKVSAKD